MIPLKNFICLKFLNMKKAFFLLICIVGGMIGFSQWSKILTLPSDEYFQATGASTDENVWVVAGKVFSTKLFIYNTPNGGTTWTRTFAHGLASSNVFQWNVERIYPVNNTTAFLCVQAFVNTGKDTGYIYKTADGGKNWVPVFVHQGFCEIKMGLFNGYLGLMSCTFLNSHALSQQKLYYTRNNGNSWLLDKLNPSNDIAIGSFETKGMQAAMVDYEYFYYSTAYGLKWTRQEVPHPYSNQYNNCNLKMAVML